VPIKRWQATQRCGNLPTIQIIIFVNYTLRQFCQKVKSGRIEISELIEVVDSFANCCPLCHGSDCAQFLGYYYRQVVDEKGRYYRDFPVPRFVCRGKGKYSVVNHKTFSLLHYHLIPYSIYSIPYVVKILKSRHIDKQTVEDIQRYQGYITATGDAYKELSASGILAFKALLRQAITKIQAFALYPALSAKLAQTSGAIDRLLVFLAFCRSFTCHRYCPPIRGPCALSYDFYISGGSYFRNAFFLFGTPSQFRSIVA